MDNSTLTRRHFLVWTGGAIVSTRFVPVLATGEADVPSQPYFASVKRVLEALDKLGEPVASPDAQQINFLASQGDNAAVNAAEKILDRYTLLNLFLSSEGTIKVTPAGSPRILIEQGWRTYLIRVANPSSYLEDLTVYIGSERYWGPGAGQLRADAKGAQIARLLDTVTDAALIKPMWLLAKLQEIVTDRYGNGIQVLPLSGIPVEYGIINLFSRDRGRRAAHMNFYGAPRSTSGVKNSGHRQVDFDCLPSRVITFGVLDTDGRGCVASLTIRDRVGHVYPPQAMRLAPDMFFQEHVYRGDGETMRLADGEYSIESTRGPEYVRGLQTVTLDELHTRIDVRLERWIDPAKWGWYSGDTHIHAAGCAHYEHPTEGVSPETIVRHVRGEGLSIAEVLTWGPSWYYQKQFFTGRAESPTAGLEHLELQLANGSALQPHATPKDSESILRYDLEVSGFPSSHAGHLVLLRLKELEYPGTKRIEEWPSWNLPILRWVKQQGAVGGYAHCGSGMAVDSTALPNYEIPAMDGVGTQEAIVDVTHGVVDFLSGCDTNHVAELNAWYHMLNCGYRMSLIGETDWPCITGDRVGSGRSYVRLDHQPVGNAGYEAWIRGLKEGQLYCGDGRSHFLEFKVDGCRSGEGTLLFQKARTANVEALVVARLEPERTQETTPRRMPSGWGWHLEWGRIGNTRGVPVELIVNGVAIDKVTLLADGTPHKIKFKTRIVRSSWVALRIIPSAHTNPVFVQIDGKPIRASKHSAQWCRACVDKIWEVKSPFIRQNELTEAAKAFDHARKTYEEIIGECEVA